MKKKRILLVFHDINNSGGTLALLDLINCWVQDKSSEYICLFPKNNGEAVDYLKNKGITTIAFRYWQAFRYGDEKFVQRILIYIKFIIGIISTLFNTLVVLKKLDIDLVYSNTSSIYAGAVISKILNKPHIWHVREYVGKDRAIVTLLPEKLHYKTISSYSECVITISQTCCDYYQKVLGKDCCIKKVYDDVTNTSTYINNWNKVKKRILFVGNIIEGKGQLVAIKALNIITTLSKDIFLTFVGPILDEKYYKKIIGYIQDNNLSNNVAFLGKISNVYEIRESNGIAIIASSNEPFGRVTIEGMQTGEIVIGAKAGCTEEIIVDNKNGFLFTPNDEVDLAHVINHVLTLDCNAIEMIRTKAFNDASQFTHGDCANKVKKIMESYL